MSKRGNGALFCLMMAVLLAGAVIKSAKEAEAEGHDAGGNPALSISAEADELSDSDTSQKIRSLNSMAEISANMFEDCDDLQEMEIPENITKIGNNAFQESGLLHIELPETVTEMGDGAFYWCSDLKSVSIHGNPVEIPRSAFTNCLSLTQVELSNDIQRISENAFAGCGSLEHMALPENLEQIGEYAFMDCGRLQVIYIPKSVREISPTAFYGCRDTMVITGESGSYAETYAAENGFLFYESGPEEWFDDGVLDLGKAEEGEAITRIPAYVRDEIVKSVRGLKRFQDEKLALHEGLESIGGETVIGGEKNTAVKQIVIPSSVKYIETGAFNGFAALEEICLPDTVEEIGTDAFSQCAGLKNIGLSKGLKSLPSRCFAYSGIEEVTIPGNIRKCLDAFQFCDHLKTVTIEEGTEELWGTFSSCGSLESVVIPSSMKRISCSAFKECSSLKDVWIYSKDIDLNYRIDYEIFGHVEFYGIGDSAETDETYYLFADSPDVVIHGYAGSAAEAFAKEKGLAFETL